MVLEAVSPGWRATRVKVVVFIALDGGFPFDEGPTRPHMKGHTFVGNDPWIDGASESLRPRIRHLYAMIEGIAASHLVRDVPMLKQRVIFGVEASIIEGFHPQPHL